MERPGCEQFLILYGPHDDPQIYCTAYGQEDVVVGCGHARLKHPGDDVRAIEARFVPIAKAAP